MVLDQPILINQVNSHTAEQTPAVWARTWFKSKQTECAGPQQISLKKSLDGHKQSQKCLQKDPESYQ